MSLSLECTDLPLVYTPQRNGEVRCQNVMGLVFYLRPIYAVPPASATPAKANPAFGLRTPAEAPAQWVNQARPESTGLVAKFLARVAPAGKLG